jgi:hypothetical protein
MEENRKKHFEKTMKGFSYNVLGVILPFILSLLGMMILKKYEKIWAFIDEGQFLLFGAGLYTSSIFLFGENKSSIRKSSDKLLSNVSLWFLIVTSALYGIIYFISLLEVRPLDTDHNFIRITSILLFVVSLLSIYRSISIDSLKTYASINVEEESQKGVNDILENL